MNDLMVYLKRLTFIALAILICAGIVKIAGEKWGGIIIFVTVFLLVILNKGRRL
jgi:hypothetical protein